MAKHDAAEGTRGEPDRIGAEGGEGPRGWREAGEEQLVEHQRGGGAVDEEVIPFDDGAEHAGPQHCAQGGRAVDDGAAHGGLLCRGRAPCDTARHHASELPDMKQRSDAALLGVLIYEGVEPIDIGGSVGVVSMARRILPAVEATVIARQAGPVRLAGGLTVLADYGVDTAPACDVVIVCGGPGWPDAAADAAVLAYLRGLRPEGVASVCTGAMILTASGILDGRMATTRRHAIAPETVSPLAMLADGGAVRTTVASVVDAGVVTGGGVSLAIDATLYLLGRIYDEDVAAEVARLMEYDRAYAANQKALEVTRASAQADHPRLTALLDSRKIRG